MNALHPPENQSEHGLEFAVYRREDGKLNSWKALGTVVAPDLPSDVHGEYRVFCMDDSAHLAAELQLRDLSADTPNVRPGQD